MRAILCPHYGPPDVLTLQEVPTPTPKPGEVLIKVAAASVSSADCRVRAMRVPRGFTPLARLALGWSRPRQPILGTELSGTIAAVGAGVTSLREGDPVFAFTGAQMGCHAEYRTLRADGLIAPKPPNLSFEEAAALSFGGTTALDFFRRAGGIQPGSRVLINGASGCVGGAATQIAKHLGAEVTAICSAPNAPLARSLGASHVIDYTQHLSPTQAPTFAPPYDLILDAVGNLPTRPTLPALRPGGHLLLIAADLPQTLLAPFASLTSRRRVIVGPASERLADLLTLSALASQSAFRPHIDRTFPFTAAADAHRHVDSGHKRGSVLLTF